ncbi:amidohydrolase family protein [Nisaea acidiphila]|uniref:Amidohydrolase family protein n=1 Tax=Nisaea acidiphila TaxID=1862145 RepID=A0A9J7AWG1_9PROT|nr:amidohydrolase family protein [Nisaea acidiphila]UUX50785.1 amidohydrolase family protein [Nisaea acidiphila]
MTEETLYEGGTILDGSGATLEAHGVMVRDGRIAELAPLDRFQGFTGFRVDFTGGTLLPGLVDCHVHLTMGGEGNPAAAQASMTPGQVTMAAFKHAQQSLMSGITALRDCGGKDYLELAVRDACNSGVQIGPSILCSGKVICMTGGHGNRNGRIADGADEVIKAVREQIHAGADLIKMMATGGVMTPGVSPEDAHFTAEEMAAGVAEGLRFRKRTASHAQGSLGILNAVRAGVASIEHGIFMDDECLKEMLDAGTYLVPTLAAVRNIVANRDNGVPAQAVEKAVRVQERHIQSIRMFYEAGGKIAMGTDAGTPFNLHGENALELRYMTEIGIKPMDAIVFSTRNGIDLMGLEGRGIVAEGMHADLLIVDGDPIADIDRVADRTNHRMVIKNGVPARIKTDDGVHETHNPADNVLRFTSAANAAF